jgi:hypothetical protein
MLISHEETLHLKVESTVLVLVFALAVCSLLFSWYDNRFRDINQLHAVIFPVAIFGHDPVIKTA